jgi:hypothetical protein
MDSRATWALLFGVWATFALDVYSSLNSSPQTTEINAKARADTLMKWVLIGDAVAIGGGIAGSIVSGSPVPLLAAGGVAVGMHLLYAHAKNSGLESSEPGTESY